ncbi:hypothetical protein MPH_07551 [Macrophomina phaseolina MS6]|uniref:Uncharacterized protein n=1 Tax=Macrophomina phaseolina (strain MS6) TaxID=1126212 RepID=K2RR29_MACPH|nr:hypothetical protein MPH_07551 [Macrophomina phaseolina MS6]
MLRRAASSKIPGKCCVMYDRDEMGSRSGDDNKTWRVARSLAPGECRGPSSGWRVMHGAHAHTPWRSGRHRRRYRPGGHRRHRCERKEHREKFGQYHPSRRHRRTKPARCTWQPAVQISSQRAKFPDLAIRSKSPVWEQSPAEAAKTAKNTSFGPSQASQAPEK